MVKIGRERLALSSTHWMFHPLRDAWARQAELGAAAVELRLQEPHVASDHVAGIDVEALRELAGQAGVRIAALAPECVYYPYQIAVEDPEARARTEAYYRLLIPAAAELGVQTVLVFGSGDTLDEDPAAAAARAVEMLCTLAPAAEAAGVTLAVRTAPGETSVAQTLPELATLLEAVGSPAVAACLDLCSMGQAGETPEQWMSMLGDQVVYVRLADGRPSGHLAWGDGLFPLEHYLEVLEGAGFSGTYGVEVDDFDRYPKPWVSDEQNWAALAPFVSGEFEDKGGAR